MLVDLIGGDVKDVVHGTGTSGFIVEKDGQLYRVRVNAVEEVSSE